MGRERTDKAYIQSGHASIEALYASKPDIAPDLIKMSRQGIGERVFKKNTGEKNYGGDECYGDTNQGKDTELCCPLS